MPILDRVTKIEEHFSPEKYLLKAALMGGSGSGKTTSALTIPGRKLLIEYDGRAQAAAGFPNVEILDLSSSDPRSPKVWMAAEAAVQELWALAEKGKLPYDAIIEDGLTLMGRYCMNWALLLDPKRGLGGAPAQQHYLPQMVNLANHVLRMKALPVHYVVTGHLELIEDEDSGSVRYLPKIVGKTARTEFEAWFNECYLCWRQQGQDKDMHYFWNTAGSGQYGFLKSTLNHLGAFWKDPIRINFSENPVGFGKLLEFRFGKENKNERAEKSQGAGVVQPLASPQNAPA